MTDRYRYISTIAKNTPNSLIKFPFVYPEDLVGDGQDSQDSQDSQVNSLLTSPLMEIINNNNNTNNNTGIYRPFKIKAGNISFNPYTTKQSKQAKQANAHLTCLQGKKSSMQSAIRVWLQENVVVKCNRGSQVGPQALPLLLPPIYLWEVVPNTPNTTDTTAQTRVQPINPLAHPDLIGRYNNTNNAWAREVLARFNYIRTLRGIQLQQITAATGISQGTLNRLTYMVQRPLQGFQINTFYRLATYFSVSLEWLLNLVPHLSPDDLIKYGYSQSSLIPDVLKTEVTRVTKVTKVTEVDTLRKEFTCIPDTASHILEIAKKDALHPFPWHYFAMCESESKSKTSPSPVHTHDIPYEEHLPPFSSALSQVLLRLLGIATGLASVGFNCWGGTTPKFSSHGYITVPPPLDSSELNRIFIHTRNQSESLRRSSYNKYSKTNPYVYDPLDWEELTARDHFEILARLIATIYVRGLTHAFSHSSNFPFKNKPGSVSDHLMEHTNLNQIPFDRASLAVDLNAFRLNMSRNAILKVCNWLRISPLWLNPGTGVEPTDSETSKTSKTSETSETPETPETIAIPQSRLFDLLTSTQKGYNNVNVLEVISAVLDTSNHIAWQNLISGDGTHTTIADLHVRQEAESTRKLWSTIYPTERDYFAHFISSIIRCSGDTKFINDLRDELSVVCGSVPTLLFTAPKKASDFVYFSSTALYRNAVTKVMQSLMGNLYIPKSDTSVFTYLTVEDLKYSETTARLWILPKIKAVLMALGYGIRSMPADFEYYNPRKFFNGEQPLNENFIELIANISNIPTSWFYLRPKE